MPAISGGVRVGTTRSSPLYPMATGRAPGAASMIASPRLQPFVDGTEGSSLRKMFMPGDGTAISDA